MKTDIFEVFGQKLPQKSHNLKNKMMGTPLEIRLSFKTIPSHIGSLSNEHFDVTKFA